MSSLSDEQINMQLEDLAGWERDGKALSKAITLAILSKPSAL